MVSNLKRIRKEQHITQAELAKRSGVPLTAIRSYEQGRRDINRAEADTLRKMAHVLERSIEEIME